MGKLSVDDKKKVVAFCVGTVVVNNFFAWLIVKKYEKEIDKLRFQNKVLHDMGQVMLEKADRETLLEVRRIGTNLKFERIIREMEDE